MSIRPICVVQRDRDCEYVVTVLLDTVENPPPVDWSARIETAFWLDEGLLQLHEVLSKTHILLFLRLQLGFD
ncbi:hypothetical protein BRD20_06950 [Halobacteriales archaeon SW_8_65_20]|nr:MAG: hypothetical protein BRD20_06950 [Halobacteriales archaeon SW_8_65_20]